MSITAQTQFAKTIDMLRDELVTGASPGHKRGAVLIGAVGGPDGVAEVLQRMNRVSEIYPKVTFAAVDPEVTSDGQTKVEIQVTGYLVDMLIFCLLCEVAEHAN
jgi:hypothetical protein